jgi:hypothetical protein
MAAKYDMTLTLSMVERKESVIHYLTGLFLKGKTEQSQLPGTSIARKGCANQPHPLRKADFACQEH